MDFFINWLNGFALNHPWIITVTLFYLVVVKALQGVRDAIDKTPLTDDNWWERTITILGKTVGYLGGVRPSAPPAATPVAGESKDAAGVKTEIK